MSVQILERMCSSPSLNNSLRLCHHRIQWYRTLGGFRPLAREWATSKQIDKGKNQGVDLPSANHHASCIMIFKRPSNVDPLREARKQQIFAAAHECRPVLLWDHEHMRL